MNRLSRKDRAAIIRALVEGNSLRSTSRITGFALNTVMKLLRELGPVCAAYQDTTLVDLDSTRIECDEIWAFCYSKDRNVPEAHEGEWGYGDVWTWVALDPDTKLVATWLVGRRDAVDAVDFITDLAPRLRNRVQITTDGHTPYLQAMEVAFGKDVDYAMLVKEYGNDPNEPRRFGPPVVLSETVKVISGNPDETLISTSYVERQNLTMRDGHAPLHSTNQRLLKEGREPRGVRRSALHVHEFRSAPQEPRQSVPTDPGNGRWTCGPHLDVRGDRGATRLNRCYFRRRRHASRVRRISPFRSKRW